MGITRHLVFVDDSCERTFAEGRFHEVMPVQALPMHRKEKLPLLDGPRVDRVTRRDGFAITMKR